MARILLSASLPTALQVAVLDEEEPVDAAQRFVSAHGLSRDNRGKLLAHLCANRPAGTEPCKRDMALLVKATVRDHRRVNATDAGPDANQGNDDSDDDDDDDDDDAGLFDRGPLVGAGPLVIWENEEPADSVHRFCAANGQSAAFRRRLTRAVCSGRFSREGSSGVHDGVPLVCKRRAAVVLSFPLSDEHGEPLGLFTLLDGEEPADAARAFASRNRVSPGFRDALLDNICSPPGGGPGRTGHVVACSRTRALAVRRPVAAHRGYPGPWHRDEAGCYRDELEVWEDEEPADGVLRLARRLDAIAASGAASGAAMPLAHRQRLIFGICGDPDLGLACARFVPALFRLPVRDEKGEAKGVVVVLEGQRPADALLLALKEAKLAQVFKHPNLRRRLFHRLCAAAAEAGTPLDCADAVPRQRAVTVELTYMGLKANLEYYFPDRRPDPLFPQYHQSAAGGVGCVPLASEHWPADSGPLSAQEEAEVARWGYDQSTVDARRMAWLKGTGTAVMAAARTAGNASRGAGLAEEDLLGAPLPTEASTGCLAPTRRAVAFFCARLSPPPTNCHRDIHGALLSHLARDDDTRWTKAGPVGIDYYQMLRCPNDAPLAEVEARMAAVGAEVATLAANISGRVSAVAAASAEGSAGLREASASHESAAAAAFAARRLLEAASLGLAVVRTGLEGARLAAKASDAALAAAAEVAEALRSRLLLACNATIHARNCTRVVVSVPLASLPPGSKQRQAALAREATEALEAETAAAAAAQNRAAAAAASAASAAAAASAAPSSSPSLASPSRNWDDLRRRKNELLGGGGLTAVEEMRRRQMDDLSRRHAELAMLSAGHKENHKENHKEGKKEGHKAASHVSAGGAVVAAAAAAATAAREAAAVSQFAAPADESRLVKVDRWHVCLERSLEEDVSGGGRGGGGGGEGEGSNAALSASAASANPALALHRSAHAAAAEGCALLAENRTWVCPAAAERLAGQLPRHPVAAALAAARDAHAAAAASLAGAKAGLVAALSSLRGAKKLADASRSGRALAAAALHGGAARLAEANATASELRNESHKGANIEAAKHRSFALERSAFDLTEGKNREFYDKPCRPVFGACCARDQADGGMSIICG